MEHLAQRNNKAMMSMLRDLDEEYCQCPFGAAGREVGYSCPGTCLDYVYDELNTSYAFACAKLSVFCAGRWDYILRISFLFFFFDSVEVSAAA